MVEREESAPQSDGGFIDFYELMQISPNAEPGTIQRVFRMLAARYHPDNPETGDMERFLRLNRAYRVLMDPASRSQYDLDLQAHQSTPIGVFSMKEFSSGIDGEANRRMGILCLLYNRRRSNPERPGVSVLELETMMACPREHLMFTIWYLKEKELIRQDQSSDFVICCLGADYVEERLPRHEVLYKLLKASEAGVCREYVGQDPLDDSVPLGKRSTENLD